MTTFTWKPLEFSVENDEITVFFHLKADDGENCVETQGHHTFNKSVIDVPFEQIKEQNIIDWLDKDTAQDDVNLIKLNLQKQLNDLKNTKKVGFPWLANTFKVQL
jgi:hypothetical protein